MVAFSKFEETLNFPDTINLVRKSILRLSCVEFSAVPLMFVLGHSDNIPIAKAIIPGLYVLVTIGNVAILKVISSCEDTEVQEIFKEAIDEKEKIPFTEIKLWPKLATLFVTSIPVYTETLATALAVGAAGDPENWTEPDQEIWSRSWAMTPLGLLAFVGWVSLPSALLVMLALNFFTHVVQLRGFSQMRVRWDGKNDYFQWAEDWFMPEAMSNASGLMMVAAVCKQMREKHQDPHDGKARVVTTLRVGSKIVCGSGPRLWLKISLLSILLRQNPDSEAAHAARLAVVMSLWHISQAVWAERKAFGDFPGMLGFILTIALPMLVCIARLVGTFCCTGHIFNVSTLSCVE